MSFQAVGPEVLKECSPKPQTLLVAGVRFLPAGCPCCRRDNIKAVEVISLKLKCCEKASCYMMSCLSCQKLGVHGTESAACKVFDYR